MALLKGKGYVGVCVLLSSPANEAYPSPGGERRTGRIVALRDSVEKKLADIGLCEYATFCFQNSRRSLSGILKVNEKTVWHLKKLEIKLYQI